jgi:hypothetical protein
MELRTPFCVLGGLGLVGNGDLPEELPGKVRTAGDDT